MLRLVYILAEVWRSWRSVQLVWQGSMLYWDDKLFIIHSVEDIIGTTLAGKTSKFWKYLRMQLGRRSKQLTSWKQSSFTQTIRAGRRKREYPGWPKLQIHYVTSKEADIKKFQRLNEAYKRIIEDVAFKENYQNNANSHQRAEHNMNRSYTRRERSFYDTQQFWSDTKFQQNESIR